MGKFEPELGQMAFGNPWETYECPQYISACLGELGEEISRVMTERTNRPFLNPAHNTGESFRNEVFEMRSYVWNDEASEDELPNFKCDDFEVRWYKYAGRSSSINRPITPVEFAQIFLKCLLSLKSTTTP